MGLLQLLLLGSELHIGDNLLEEAHARSPAPVELEDTHPDGPHKIPPACDVDEPIKGIVDGIPELLIEGLLPDGQHRDEQPRQQRYELLAQVHIVIIEYLQQRGPQHRRRRLCKEREQPHAVQAQVLGEQLDVFVDVPVHGIPHILEHLLVDSDHALVGFRGQRGVQALVQPL